MIVPPAVRTKVVEPEARAIEDGSVRWSGTPVSPVTPFRVRVWTFPEGGIMVAAVTVLPPVGKVMVFAPEASVWSVTEPGEDELDAAEIVSVPVTSPVKTRVIVLVEATAIS